MWEMSVQDVEDLVYQSAADGANGVTMSVGERMCNPQMVERVHAFIAAGKEAKQQVADGAGREELGQRVSSQGREKLWNRWCGFLSPESTRGGAKTIS